MTATTTTLTTVLPRNRTGLFAGDTLQEVQTTQHHALPMPISSAHYRQSGSANLLLASSEQSRSFKSENQLRTIHHDERSSTNGMRNGFRPSTVRRQKFRATTASTQRDNHLPDGKDLPNKQKYPHPLGSTRLQSEVDLLKRHGAREGISQLQNHRDITNTPQSTLSLCTTDRISSASTNQIISRLHQRYSSAITNGTVSTLVSTPRLPAPSPPNNEEDDRSHRTATHIYQIPQRSNIGSESVFPVQSLPSTAPPSSGKTQFPRHTRRSNRNKPISCPFYVMYFTNLALQQNPNDSANNRTPLSIPSSRTTTYGETVTTRTPSSSSRQLSTKRQVHSPISMNTYSTMEEDETLTTTTPYYNKKRFSSKITAFENENTHLLKDILRTTSWNHVQV